jgi:cyclomaltodextrinase / maltogenic alpha-amylase / neopullulanase
VSQWVRHAIWWQVYPLGFTGAERTALPEGAEPVPRLRQVEAWLPHLVQLGCNGLALGPVFAAQTHGYDTVDHFRVDPRLGTEADLQRLLDACAAAGVRVLLDGVFNHVGRGHPRFRQLLAEGPDSATARWFHVQHDPQAPDGFRYRDFEGHSALVTLDHDAPEVAELVTDVMTAWCDRGVDAWRLDAAYAVPPAFWQRVLPAVRERHPDLWVVGEVIHGDYAGYVEQSGIDSVTQYELWKAVWSSIGDRNLFELAHALRRHDDMVRRFLPQTFVGNHDVTRLASRLPDRRHLALAVAVLLTVPGIPTLYYGDEWALEGVKEDRAGGDDAVRPAFPPTPQDTGWAADPARAAVAGLHRTLIGLRRRHPWLVDARLAEPDVLRNELLALRLRGDGQQLALVLNLADAPADVVLPLPGAQLLAGSGDVRPRGGSVVATAAPHAFLVVGS